MAAGKGKGHAFRAGKWIRREIAVVLWFLLCFHIAFYKKRETFLRNGASCRKKARCLRERAVAPRFQRLRGGEKVAAKATDAVLQASEAISPDAQPVKGYDFNNGTNFDALFNSFENHGFQATCIAKAINEIKKMLELKRKKNITIFLGYTSNMVSCGNREVIRYLLEHRLVDAVVTTAGGIEEDVMKTLRPHYMGSFDLSGRVLRKKGHNRIGNLLVPNENYCLFEKWVTPFLDSIVDEYTSVETRTLRKIPGSRLQLKQLHRGDSSFPEWQISLVVDDDTFQSRPLESVVAIDGVLVNSMLKNTLQLERIFGPLAGNQSTNFAKMGLRDVTVDVSVSSSPLPITPSEMISKMGRLVNNTESILYQAYKNDVPIFCPALTDGSVGDMIFFHSYKRPGLVLDIARDLRQINELAMNANNTGMLILGGGVVKHHICNANLMRNGADFAVFINTAHDFDGSDAGAKPDEAISWGKIKLDADPVKVCGDASFIFPLIVAQTFAKYVESERRGLREK